MVVPFDGDGLNKRLRIVESDLNANQCSFSFELDSPLIGEQDTAVYFSFHYLLYFLLF